MNWTPELKSFIAQHMADDTDRLLLSAQRYPGVDVREAVEQICARHQIRNKLPEWFANEDIIMGGRIPAEQCSSEQTARYKRQLVCGESLCDLTGGMGVDFYYMSQGLRRAVYTERQAHLVEAVEHNMGALYGNREMPEFEFRLGDGRQMSIPDVDTLYLDPARRSFDGSRVYDIADCEPDVVAWQDELLEKCAKLIVKVSPMADISRALEQLRHVTDVHVIAVKNECKEVLIEMQGVKGDRSRQNDVRIHCVDFRTNDVVQYSYYYQQEQESTVRLLQGDVLHYLYEPDVTLMKAGVFKKICADFEVSKLDANSHYYTSNLLLEDFPGRIFEVDAVAPFSGKMLKSLKKEIPQANIASRNFPLTADQLRSRSGIKDGGEVYLFATSICKLGAILLKCHKVALMLLISLFVALAPSNAWARKKNQQKTEETLASLLRSVAEESPYNWHQGMEFVYLDNHLTPILVPEIAIQPIDTLELRGGVWRYDAIVSEEDWMGQQKMQLRFFSPSGKPFRFNTGRVMSQVPDKDYKPALGVLQPREMYQKVDSILRARTLYICINDERILGIDETNIRKFVEVEVDSVTSGNELAPLRVWFSCGDVRASFLCSMPESRENSTSTSIDKYLSLTDPYLLHPNISADIWQLIQRNGIQPDMTLEEVRLSLGRPLRFERLNSKGGAIERWYYPNSRVLEFWDGRLRLQGREK